MTDRNRFALFPSNVIPLAPYQLGYHLPRPEGSAVITPDHGDALSQLDTYNVMGRNGASAVERCDTDQPVSTYEAIMGDLAAGSLVVDAYTTPAPSGDLLPLPSYGQPRISRLGSVATGRHHQTVVPLFPEDPR